VKHTPWERLELALDDVAAESLKVAQEQRGFVGLGKQERRLLADAFARALRTGSGQVRCLRPATRSEAKSVSRAYKTLEQRGLLWRLRRDGTRGVPVHSVFITRAGLAMAQRIEERQAA
jgi:hypothetical protein